MARTSLSLSVIDRALTIREILMNFLFDIWIPKFPKPETSKNWKFIFTSYRFLDRFRTITNIMGDAIGCAIVEFMCQEQLAQMDREKAAKKRRAKMKIKHDSETRSSRTASEDAILFSKMEQFLARRGWCLSLSDDFRPSCAAGKLLISARRRAEVGYHRYKSISVQYDTQDDLSIFEQDAINRVKKFPLSLYVYVNEVSDYD